MDLLHTLISIVTGVVVGYCMEPGKLRWIGIAAFAVALVNIATQ